ncbi:MAG: hypothetical protein ACK5MQ_02670 [Pikeienuella sp.]
MRAATPRRETGPEKENARPLRLIVNRGGEAARPAPRDWSNVVFSVAFCEEARRIFENRQTA